MQTTLITTDPIDALRFERVPRAAKTQLQQNLDRARLLRASMTPADPCRLVTSVYIADVRGIPVWAVEAARKALGLPLMMTPEQARRVA